MSRGSGFDQHCSYRWAGCIHSHMMGHFVYQIETFYVLKWSLLWMIKEILQLSSWISYFNSSPPGQNGCHFADNIFRCIFINKKFCILIKISLSFVPKGPNWQYTSIGLDNGIAPNRQQAIIWTNAHPIHWCIYAYMRHKLTHRKSYVDKLRSS